MTNTQSKKYGRGGSPVFLRMGLPERAAWNTVKANYEARHGRPLSHSRFIALVIDDMILKKDN